CGSPSLQDAESARWLDGTHHDGEQLAEHAPALHGQYAPTAVGQLQELAPSTLQKRRAERERQVGRVGQRSHRRGMVHGTRVSQSAAILIWCSPAVLEGVEQPCGDFVGASPRSKRKEASPQSASPVLIDKFCIV